MATSKNNDIQCLRALAILMVLLQHYRGRLPAPDSYLRIFDHFNFWPGVDIFFAISGFLICQTFLRDLSASSSRREAVYGFWIRRMARLLPAVVAWCVISVFVAYYAASYAGAEPAKVALSGLMAILGLSNFYWVECVKAGQNVCGSADFNGVTWSLSLEWQLYAALSMLLCFAGKRKAIGIMLFVATLMSFLPAPGFSYPWAFRIQSFTLGALVYCVLSKRDGDLPSIPSHLATTLALIITGTLLCILAPTKLQQPFVIPTIALGSLLCLLGAIGRRQFSSSPAFYPLIWIGERSYSIYLCHLPVLIFIRETMHRYVGLSNAPQNLAIAFASAVVLIAVLADLSYRFIERPFQERAKKRFSRGKIGSTAHTAP
ncbi:acyltransferase family protein [Cupriavidus necator]